MIRRLLVTTALLTVAGSALAADLPARGAPAPYVAAPIFTWTGLYVGLNAGAAHSVTKTSDLDYYGDFEGTKEMSKNGFTGGAQIGYNWQMGALVLGLEADINALQNNNHEVDRYDAFRTKMTSLGTVRGRAGVAVDRALIYVTGGLAYGKVNNGYGYYCDTDCNNFNGFTDSFVSSKTRFGWVVGAGVEYALTQNVSVKVEGLYVDLGSNTVGCNSNYCSTPADYRARFENTAAIGRIGVNYKFW
jgi:outer membrane immunogenic protein